jgi:GNAT superfamily N-acetyltransferase
MADCSVIPIRALTGAQLARIGNIYAEAFSPDLRVPFRELTAEGDIDRTLVALDGRSAVGFAALRLLRSVDWSFLRYFAIDASRRGQGIGRQFWDLLPDCLQAGAWPRRIVFEVEDPAEAAGSPAEAAGSPAEAAGSAAERVIRERRIRFWTDCGARLLPVPGYVLPDYTGSGMTEPMLLMAGAPEATPVVEGDALRSLVLAIYSGRYGLPGTHPLVSRALASIPAAKHSN